MATVVPIHPSQSLPKAVRDSQRYAQHGLALPQATMRALKKRGIHCQTFVTLEYQRGTQRYVLRGTESGGAVDDMGHYCAFLDTTGEPIPWLQPVDSLAVNGRHALVIAPEFVRIEMLRIGRTYDLILTEHALVKLPGTTRPRVASRVLFRGQQGTLAIELWKAANRELRGELAPVFYTSSGEVRPLPAHFEHAVRLLSGGVCCIGCKQSHVAVAAAPVVT
ncbi:MAG TPA: hypothetical protein VGM27_33745 [Acidobacteriaceae bacterium]